MSSDIDKDLDRLIEEIVEKREPSLTTRQLGRSVGAPPRKLQDITRVSTGIPELDKALEGGVPKGSWVAITGEPGTGKSIMCMHFAYAGLKVGDPVIYITTEAEFRDVVRQAKQFGMDFEEYPIYNLGGKEPDETPRIVVIDIFGLLKMARQLSLDNSESDVARRRRYAALEIPTLVAAIHEAYQVLGVVDEGRKSPRTHVRLVVDSMSAFWADKPAMARRYSYELKIATHRENVTAYLVSQYAMTTKSLDSTTPVPIVCKERIVFTEIGELYNKLGELMKLCGRNGVLMTYSVDISNGRVVLGRIRGVIRHSAPKILYRVVTVDDREVIVTSDHSIYSVRKGRLIPVTADTLRRGSKLLAFDRDSGSSRVKEVEVAYVEPVEPTTEYVYDISVEFHENFLAGKGMLLAHNSTFGFGLEHIADGVFHLWMEDVEKAKEVRRYFIIKKMRMTNHTRKAFRLEIVDGRGIVLEEL